MKSLFIGIILILVVGIFAAANRYFALHRNSDAQACTLEAKQCPDGSSVGRTGPACSFAECPTATENNNSTDSEVVPNPVSGDKNEETVFCTADVKECQDGSYVGRVGPSCSFAPCP